MALSGSPLGMEVDVQRLQHQKSCVRFAPTTSFLDKCYHTPKKLISPKYKGKSSDYDLLEMEDENDDMDTLNEHDSLEIEEENNDVMSNGECSTRGEGSMTPMSHINGEHTTSNSYDKKSPPEAMRSSPRMTPLKLLDMSHYAEYSRMRAYQHAKLSYEFYSVRNGEPPDYGVAIEMGFNTINGDDSIKLKAAKSYFEERHLMLPDNNSSYCCVSWNNNSSSSDGAEIKDQYRNTTSLLQYCIDEETANEIFDKEVSMRF